MQRLVAAALAVFGLCAPPVLAAPAGCVKPTAANAAVTVVAPADKPVVGGAIVGTPAKKDNGLLPGDGAGTKVADASDRCPAGYVQQYFQQPSTRPIQYVEAAPVAEVVTASADAKATPPKSRP